MARTPPFVLAQSLLEYISLQTVRDGVAGLYFDAEEWIRRQDPALLIGAAAILIALWLIRRVLRA